MNNHHIDKVLPNNAMSKERLDIYLSHKYPQFSRSKLQNVIDKNKVFVNGKVATKKTLVSSNDTILFDPQFLESQVDNYLIAQDISLSILYEDEYFIAINKPAGMVVHPGNGNKDGTLVNALLFHAKLLSQGSEPLRPGIVHRLDKDTSGVILVAKSDLAHNAFAAMFANREIKKKYLGICIGGRPHDDGEINFPLGRSARDPVKRSVRHDGTGKIAKTHYRLLAFENAISIVEFSPLTGRTHQIRVHASASGFPVICDPMYGSAKDVIDRMPVLERPFVYSIYKCFSRHALHALSQSFVHPFTGKNMVLRSPLPDDFTKAIKLFNEQNRKNVQKAINC